MKIKQLFLVASISLGGVLTAAAQEQPEATSRTTNSRMSDADFIDKTIRDSKMEVEMARMAIEKSENENIKDAAEVLIRDHTEILENLQRLDGGSVRNQQEMMENTEAKDSLDVTRSQPGDTGTASNQLDIAGTKTSREDDSTKTDSAAKNDAMAAQTGGASDPHTALANAQGAEFDKLWINEMLTKHKIKLGELHQARRSVTDPELKEIVTEAIPEVREHRDMLASLKNDPNQPIEANGKDKTKKQRKDVSLSK